MVPGKSVLSGASRPRRKIHVTGTVTFDAGRTYEKYGVPGRGADDDRGRVPGATCFQQGTGGAGER
jgi:hypothetical protein